MQTLTGARLLHRTGCGVEIGLDRGFRLWLFVLEERLARMVITRPAGLRMARSWSLSPELAGPPGDDAIAGRDRLDLSGFPGAEFAIAETAEAIRVESRHLQIDISRAPLGLSWSFCDAAGEPFRAVLEDRGTQPYRFARPGPQFVHALKRDAAERYYGFGEKTGNADKHGRRLRMGTTDALGYDAESSDPLYKHIPFYITVRPDLGGAAAGLFYDNLARAAFDLGQEIDAYHGPYRAFEAEDGDLDLYVIFGPAIRDVVARFTALTGRAAFAPRWSLGYSGSTMQYTDAPDATARLDGFLDLIAEHGISCGSFHMSSGYTLIVDKRYVFTWDRARFPDPKALARRFADAGVRLIANIKPAMLLDHPRFAEVEAFQGFVHDGDDPARPHLAQFWGGEAAYLDFTNPLTSQWWSRQVGEQLLDNGITATWNDNNEFEIRDDEAGAHAGPMACLRPVQTALMLRASRAAQIAHAPGKRPFLVSRSGGPGLQRYAQTWTGDNRTDWKTLRYNLRMGHGLSLSGLFNFGHDVGGFAGRRPEPELFMRWIEQGIFWPRFSIHSWNDDGSASEPWMYPELLPMIRAAFAWRERLVPYLYTLLWRAHAHHEPILRPLFYDFPAAPESYAEEDSFMVGPDVVVAPVLEPGTTRRRLWLPDAAGGWFDLRDGTPYPGGGWIETEAPLGAAPAFVRAGAILPLGPSRSWADGPLTLRLYPGDPAATTIYDDDGESHVDWRSPPCLIEAEARWSGGAPLLSIRRSGPHEPRWSEIRFEDAAGQGVEASVNGAPPASAVPFDAIGPA
ncbi:MULTISPECIES: glycoside hydrolase family 31 protein [Rhodomicrobium]|uniref:glycoside hydrolase family 31 protein n=1 Tax=Rhodomicrobium TaxID=1068 RepID=UPI000B4AA8BE|nr:MULTISPECIES: glycoside hydrolase family 31 protein [Rhodomicrobium]